MKKVLWVFPIVTLLLACQPQESEPLISGVESPPKEFSLPIALHQQKSLRDRLQERGFALGSKVFLRIFKEENVLEVWMLRADARYHLYKTYPICAFSGGLGPKRRRGDMQSPEGFYQVSAQQMKPDSAYHLAFNLGFPNAYDRAQGYTGNYLMVHGDCVSVGCYAMGDDQIEEIYALVSAAHQHGQLAVPVHIFPFALRAEKLEAYRHHEWYAFWKMLQEGYDYFERERIPPKIDVVDGRYVVSLPLQGEVGSRSRLRAVLVE